MEGRREDGRLRSSDLPVDGGECAGRAEVSTDVPFRRREDLAPVCDRLLRAAIHAAREEAEPGRDRLRIP